MTGWRRILRAAAAALACACAGAAAAPVVLSDATQRIEPWHAVTVLSDPSHTMTLAQARAAVARFEAPRTAAMTLGQRRDAVWLRLPLAVAADSDGHWILNLDYAPLNHADVYVLDAAGSEITRARLGGLQPFSQRPMLSRAHALELSLPPGAAVEVWMRVQTQGGMILPLALSKPRAFLQHALREQMLQGLLTGLGMLLLLYSLAQWLSVRENLFIKYVVLTGGSVMFSVAQFGIGAQYLWPESLWLERHAAAISALVASAGTFLFVEEVLRGPDAYRWFSRLMKGGAALLLAIAAAYALGWVDVYFVSNVIGTLGLAPALLGMPGAISRARRGDSVGWYFLAAWLGYFICTAIMVAVIKGRLPANFWTLHSFQIGATLDMLLFLRVLALRLQAVHAEARRAQRERESLLSMAFTDALTGLPNRRGLDAALARALPDCHRERMLAVYLIDLDGFKDVNDRLGHDAGDALLCVAASRLRARLRSTDAVARLGGDEFVVLAEGLQGDAQAHELGQQLLAAFEEPIDVNGQACVIGLTIGYTLAPTDGLDASALLRRADAAMYAGKQAGKRCLRRAEGVPA
jgi:diguanylate cyclase